MSPPNPENDPVHKGLQRLGDEVDQASPPPEPADDPVERGLHELGRQIDAARPGGKGGRRKGAHAAPRQRSRRRTVGYVVGTLGLVIALLAGGDRRVRLVPQPRDPPDRPPQPDLFPGQGRGRRH